MTSPPPRPGVHADVDLSLLVARDHLRHLPAEEVSQLREVLRCFIIGHTDADCPDGHQTSVSYLLQHRFLRPVDSPGTGRITHRFTTELVSAIAQLSAHGSRIDWDLVQTVIDLNCDESLDRNTFSVLFHTATLATQDLVQLLAAEQLPGTDPPTDAQVHGAGGGEVVDPPAVLLPPTGTENGVRSNTNDNSPAALVPTVNVAGVVDEEISTEGAAEGLHGYLEDPYLPPSGAFRRRPAPIFPEASMDDSSAVARLCSNLMREFTRSQRDTIDYFRGRENDNTNVLLSHTTHQILEAHVHAGEKFYGYTELGKENYFWFRQNFLDRADRLNWSPATRVVQLIGSTTFRARRLLLAKRNTVFGDAVNMFIDDFDALLRFMDETFAAAGIMYSLDTRKTSRQLEKETMQDYYARTTNERRRFWDVFRPYVQSQLSSSITYLPPHVPAREATEVAFEGRVAGLATSVISAIVNVCVGDGPKATFCRSFLSEQPAVQDAVGRAIVNILNEERTAKSTAAFETFLKFDHWKFLNWDLLDGCANQKVKEEAYKERDKRWTKVDLAGDAGDAAVTDFVNHLVRLEDRITNNRTIFNNGANIGSLGTDGPEGDAQVDANSGNNGKRKRGNRGGRGNNQGNNKNGNKAGAAAVGGAPGKAAPATPPSQAAAPQPRAPPPSASPPQPPQAAAVGRAPPPPPHGRGGPRGAAPPRPGPARRPGEFWFGDDGFRRCVGATCERCGKKGHLGIDCQSAPAVGAGAIDVVPGLHPYATNHPFPSSANVHNLLAPPLIH